MKISRYLVVVALSSLVMAACDDSSSTDEKQTTALCKADNTCADASKVCINGYCLDKCSADSCGEGFYCADNGICSPKEDPSKDPECSDSKPCTDTSKSCVKGVCQPNSADPECSDAKPCADTTKKCINGVCQAKSNGTACSGSQKCEVPGRVCSNGQCVTKNEAKMCANDAACDASQYCDSARCVDRCTTEAGCTDHRVCNAEGKCVEKCYTNKCPSGQACDSTGLCVDGECTAWQRCSEGGFDKSYVCDVENRKCIKRCSAGTCGAGKYCDSEEGLCFEGECSEVDECTGTKVCDLAKHVCVEKCTDDDSCGDKDKLCDTDGRCVSPCAHGTCKGGKVCDPESKLCIVAECSDLDACPINYQVCESGVCKDKCTMMGVKCDDGFICDKNNGHCVPACTADSCTESGMVCGNEGKCVFGECSDLVPCQDTNKVCSVLYKCVSPKKNGSDCWFYSLCDNECNGEAEGSENCTRCRERSHYCDEGKQCNASNQCIDSKNADGRGQGERCDDANKCASDLVCKNGACVHKAFEKEGDSCSPSIDGSYCDGNIIVECNSNSGLFMVSDCKAYYLNLTSASTASFYGKDFTCGKLPGENYYTCIQECSDADAKAHKKTYACGWEPDDSEIEYSDQYTCGYSDEGIAGYFQDDSKECWTGCNFNTGLCD